MGRRALGGASARHFGRGGRPGTIDGGLPDHTSLHIWGGANQVPY
jgi:hypothetical protein